MRADAFSDILSLSPSALSLWKFRKNYYQDMTLINFQSLHSPAKLH